MPQIRYLHKTRQGIPSIYSQKSGDILQNMNFSRCYRNRGKVIYGFDPNIIYIKYVQKDEIEEIYDKKTYAVYEGYKFIVVDETEKQILILTMNGDYQEWIRLGMECIDKGMYQKWINKNEAEIEVLKEKI